MDTDLIEQIIDESVDVILQCKKDAKIIQSVANEIISCFENNNKVVLFTHLTSTSLYDKWLTCIPGWILNRLRVVTLISSAPYQIS